MSRISEEKTEEILADMPQDVADKLRPRLVAALDEAWQSGIEDARLESRIRRLGTEIGM